MPASQRRDGERPARSRRVLSKAGRGGRTPPYGSAAARVVETVEPGAGEPACSVAVVHRARRSRSRLAVERGTMEVLVHPRILGRGASLAESSAPVVTPRRTNRGASQGAQRGRHDDLVHGQEPRNSAAVGGGEHHILPQRGEQARTGKSSFLSRNRV